LAGIEARAREAGVIDIHKAIEDFKANTLRGKTNMEGDWQVCHDDAPLFLDLISLW